MLLTPHMGCFEVTAQAIAERYCRADKPITVLYRPARKAWLRELVLGRHLQSAVTILGHGETSLVG